VANSIVYGNGGSNLGGIPSGSVVPSVALTTSNPKFNNPSAGDFSLQAGSPAIDAGTNSVQGLPFLDYSGRLRVASATGAGQGTVDMGALEANSLYPLVFPLAANGSQSSLGGAFTTGIALLNPNSSTAQLNVTAYNGSGTPLPTTFSQSLGGGDQIAELYYQMFLNNNSSTAQMGSVLATSNFKLAGFSLVFDPAFSLFSTGTNATAQAGTDLVFMRHDPDANGITNYYVVSNPGVNATNVTATLYNTSGGQVGQSLTATIAPKAQTVFNFSSSTAGYVTVQQLLSSNIVPLSGVEVVGNSTRLAALGAFSPGSEARIFFPHYAVGGGTTTQIGIINTSGSPANVTLNAYDNNADLVGTTSFQIAVGGQFLGSVADVFQIPTTGAVQVGYLIAQGDQPGLMGYTDFTYSNGSHSADASLPADSVPSTGFFFSQIANGVASNTGAKFWTGIALVNPYGTQVPYTMTVYDPSGNIIATGNYTLGPHQKVSEVLCYPGDSDLNSVFFAPNPTLLNLLHGYVEVSSSYGIIGLAIYYTEDLSQMASVPAQTQ
jgi:hypothetical protein